MEKDTIIIHCSATRGRMDFHAADIDRWHRHRGFAGIGYHYVITLDGTVETGRPYTAVGAHAIGWNTRAVGVCYIGGLNDCGIPADTRTPEQKEAIKSLIVRLLKEHRGLQAIFRHNEIVAKACPCFNARAEYAPLLCAR